MITEALVDVIVPVYNAAPTIEQALRSICLQTLEHIRIIVVDDGSTDATPVLLARIANDDPRVRVVTTENRGIVQALNTALSSCTAPYVARHDADDLAFPERLARQLAFLEDRRDCVAVGCNAHHIDATGKRIGTRTHFVGDVMSDPLFVPSKEPYLMHPFLMVRRDAMISAGGYRAVHHAEDTDLYWRLLAMGGLYNLPDVLGEYRIHAESVTGRSIVNGRVAAVASQLAAISQRRRVAGRHDLRFATPLAAYEAAASFEHIVRLGAIDLDPAETAYLTLAAAVKLLELTSYRPYQLATDDVRAIHAALSVYGTRMTAANRRQVVFKQLLLNRLKVRRFREAWLLIPARLLSRAVVELAAHLIARLIPLHRR